jgi:mandelate racemase
LVGTQTGLTISNLRARMVNVPMERPVQTSAGEIRAALLVLIDLQTEEGITGRAYVRSYSTFALEPLKQLVENLGAALAGEALAPLEIYRKLQAMFRLLGPQGLTVTASSARPIASTSASRVRAPALRSSPLSLAKASSMGLRSGE